MFGSDFAALLGSSTTQASVDGVGNVKHQISALLQEIDVYESKRVGNLNTDASESLRTVRRAAASIDWGGLEGSSSLLAVIEGFPGQREARDAINALRDVVNRAVCDGKLPPLGDSHVAVANAFAKIDGLEAGLRRAASRTRFAIRTVSLLALISAPAAGAYLYLQRGLSPVSTEVLFPPGPYQNVDADSQSLSAVPDMMDEFLFEFAKYYFDAKLRLGEQSRFPAMFLEKLPKSQVANDKLNNDAAPAAPPAPAPPPPASAIRKARTTTVPVSLHTAQTADEPGLDSNVVPHIRLKSSIKNLSQFGSLFVSNVSVTVRFVDAERFPWHRVPVVPILSVTDAVTPRNGVHPTPLLIKNIGIGPAVDVSWCWRTTKGDIIGTGTNRLIFDMANVPLPLPGDSFSPWPVSTQEVVPPVGPRDQGVFLGGSYIEPVLIDGERQLGDPMYHLLTNLPDPVIPDLDFEFERRWYRTLKTIEQLQTTTTVVYNEPIDLVLDYRGLDEIAYQCYSNIDLPSDVLFYRRDPAILERDPRSPGKSGFAGAPSSAAAASGVESLARFLGPPTPDPKGVDLIVSECEVDVGDAVESQGMRASVSVDKFLNAKGMLALYITILRPATGTYEVRITVDGQVVERRFISTIAPESLRFPTEPDDQWREALRIRKQVSAARKQSGAAPKHGNRI